LVGRRWLERHHPRHCERLRRLAPAYNGSMGILKGHAPLMALLGTGTLRIDAGGSSKSYAVSGGFLQVVDDTVTVLSESATAA
jgi:F-type H+-transporting ATPase subunit epsilon